MNGIDLRVEIERVLTEAWPVFAGEHPRLARVLEVGMLVDAVAEHFADDGDCQHLLADAAARAGIGSVVKRLTLQWLWSLI
ncbi:MAG TPA: hypothetical protein VFE58_17870 [Tepidisphaeraceae bacterium]|jgi:hypothetical protein|nr:hypothetical protein [Tepidisphaeraceae bacterium]